jgi:hypothetical protein
MSDKNGSKIELQEEPQSDVVDLNITDASEEIEKGHKKLNGDLAKALEASLDEVNNGKTKDKKEKDIPPKIEEVFHLYEKWIPANQSKVSFRVADYNNGEFTLVYDVSRKQKERIKKVDIKELRQRIKDGKYSIEDLSKVDLKKKTKKRGKIEKEKWEDETADYLHLTEKTFGEDGKQSTNLDFAKAVLFSQVGKWEELNAKTPEEGEKIINGKIRQFFVEMGLAVHEMVKEGFDEKGKKSLVPNEKTDLDGKSVLFFLKKAGIEVNSDPKTGNVEYVIPGTHALGRVTFDSGMVEGVEIRKEQNEKGEWVISVIADHHGDTSPRDTSATEVVYETFEKLGMFSEYFEKNPEAKEGVEKLVKFINQVDNFDYPNGKEYFKNYFQNSWDTMLGISRMLGPQNLLDFFLDGHSVEDAGKLISDMNLNEGQLRKYGILQLRDINDGEKLEAIAKKYQIEFENGKLGKISEESLKKIRKDGISFDPKRKVLRERVDVRESHKVRVKKTENVLQEMNNGGFIIDSERFGKIAVDIDKKVSTGAEAAKAFGCSVYIIWNPEYDSFFISSLQGETLWDSDGRLFAEKFKQGTSVRKTMWIKSLAEKDEPLNVKLEDILGELTDGKFVPTGKLKEYIDNGGKWEEDGKAGVVDDEKKKKDGAIENSFTGKNKGGALGEEVGVEVLSEEDEVMQLDSRWKDFVSGMGNETGMGGKKEEESEKDEIGFDGDAELELADRIAKSKEIEEEPEVEPISEPISAKKPTSEVGKMSLGEFEKMRRELDSSREFYVGYSYEFEKKRKNLEKYFGKVENPDFFGQAQEEVKNLKEAYSKKSEEYIKEHLATMRKWYEDEYRRFNIPTGKYIIDEELVEKAMIEEEIFLGVNESLKTNKTKDKIENEMKIDEKAVKSFRSVFGEKLKGFWNGIWKSTKEKTSAGVDLGRQGAENVKQGVETEMYNIGQNIEIVKDAVETGLSADKRKRREEILDRRQIGRKRSSDLSQEEKNEISPEARAVEKVQEKDMSMMNFVKKFMDGDLRVWKEYKGKNIRSVIKGSGPQREEKKKFFGNLGRIIDFSREEFGKDYMNDNIKVGNWILKIFTEAERRKKAKEIFEVIESE